MRSDNLPATSLRLVVVKRQDRTATCRLQRQMPDGEWWTHYQSIWESGRPTAGQWEEVLAQLVALATDTILAGYGVQGVLPG